MSFCWCNGKVCQGSHAVTVTWFLSPGLSSASFVWILSLNGPSPTPWWLDGCRRLRVCHPRLRWGWGGKELVSLHKQSQPRFLNSFLVLIFCVDFTPKINCYSLMVAICWWFPWAWPQPPSWSQSEKPRRYERFPKRRKKEVWLENGERMNSVYKEYPAEQHLGVWSLFPPSLSGARLNYINKKQTQTKQHSAWVTCWLLYICSSCALRILAVLVSV